jgi:pimeloyl-ACP methyl ester carboxylesterase
LAAVFVLFAGWTVWSELNPQAERTLRVHIHDQLDTWFPEAMAPTAQESGFVATPGTSGPKSAAEVILVHGLDEPGGIWDELHQALDREAIAHVEFRYPNDQGIDASADALARHWTTLDADRPVFLVGHSMGGLVIRDFVSRHRHPPTESGAIGGPAVGGVVLVGTPNHGSEWARLRAGLELREFAADLPAGRFSLFAALRDGTGAAKIDLRPESRYLRDLNARRWPESVPIRIIGGRIAGPTPMMEARLGAVSQDLDLPELADAIEQLWQEGGEAVGDGAVPISSLPLPEAPPPLILPASHRGLIADMPWSEAQPPAIPYVIDYIIQWRLNADDSSERERE